ncbi:hypothetical protein LFL96_31260 [Paraburkholderia sp. D15]|uniref:hypothetical protein n=1 Tax=Paraburkholderia sp. D15 TaxID=2880218 RepID=UPI002478B325|nr:hypothetical protein [Paraburkholderia sp. D15]WGS52665.1 hypothetical protein LFL96_31260 [Paraburkholderia sp. D15]WKF61915.1 hypothetical protein HUO10_006447 [Paraburkholderia busanensis]
MRYRALDANGDYSWGQGPANFLVDSPEAVAQLVLTRLNLKTGEWFLDTTEGTPYDSAILGAGTASTRDLAIQQRILDTQGVTGITDYASAVSPVNRAFVVAATIDTIYGETTFSTVL